MLVPIARGRKDAKAIKHALGVEVLTLKGLRRLDPDLLKGLENKIPVFFFGKEDHDLAEEVKRLFSQIHPLYLFVLLPM